MDQSSPVFFATICKWASSPLWSQQRTKKILDCLMLILYNYSNALQEAWPNGQLGWTQEGNSNNTNSLFLEHLAAGTESTLLIFLQGQVCIFGNLKRAVLSLDIRVSAFMKVRNPFASDNWARCAKHFFPGQNTCLCALAFLAVWTAAAVWYQIDLPQQIQRNKQKKPKKNNLNPLFNFPLAVGKTSL